MTTPWTPELCERLTALAASGIRPGEIAHKLGMSKSQIIGKAYRLRVAIRGNKPTTGLPSVLSKSTADGSAKLGCRWIEGDVPALMNAGLTFDQMICNRALVRLGDSWCDEHRARAWVKPPTLTGKPFGDLQFTAPKERGA